MTRMDEYKFFNDLCNQVGEWSQRNFGDQGTYRPLLGIIEELGELLDGLSNLDREDTLDAVADTIIYMADYFYRWQKKSDPCDFSWDLGKAWMDRALVTGDSPDVTSMRRLMRMLAHHHLKGEQGIRGGAEKNQELVRDDCRLVLEHLQFVCGLLYSDIFTVVTGTWARVSQRDWKKNPNTAHEVAVDLQSIPPELAPPPEPSSELEQAGAAYVASRMGGNPPIVDIPATREPMKLRAPGPLSPFWSDPPEVVSKDKEGGIGGFSGEHGDGES